MSRIGNLTRLIHTLLYVMTIHTYQVHAYITSLLMHNVPVLIAQRTYRLSIKNKTKMAKVWWSGGAMIVVTAIIVGNWPALAPSVVPPGITTAVS